MCVYSMDGGVGERYCSDSLSFVFFLERGRAARDVEEIVRRAWIVLFN